MRNRAPHRVSRSLFVDLLIRYGEAVREATNARHRSTANINTLEAFEHVANARFRDALDSFDEISRQVGIMDDHIRYTVWTVNDGTLEPIQPYQFHRTMDEAVDAVMTRHRERIEYLVIPAVMP